ncbi:hypothetical protein DBR32_11570 [Taibaiella sp. KBW10]|uniref:hypothetical protein n=1 Tax=Taibaiella sp. KBW10 TaxID=2153357 RepID=UPI000F5B111C|nr:hypothetical protein [Taibaiella sp. KBW10]RQO30212.1 hypothetical protein DBR32_11570 [Taibaiella sp. KBW10]
MTKLYAKHIVRISLTALCLTGFNQYVQAQNTYLNYGSDEYHLLDRLETNSGQLISEFSMAQKPVSRKDAVWFLSQVVRSVRTRGFQVSDIDKFNIDRAISISGEWYENASGESGSIDSKRPVLKYFYKKQADLLQVHNDDFFLAVNPIIYAQAGYERNVGLKTTNTRGLEFRGRIADKIGFYTMLADNQEKIPTYAEDWVARHRGQFPGEHYAVKNGNNYDLFLARGYVDFSMIRNHIGVTFGYDRNQMGYGIRSLAIANSSAPATFLRLRSQWGRFSYENLYTELVANNTILQNGDGLLPRKYASIHQLNFTPNHWLSVGIFESTVFAKKTGIPVEMLLPVIGLQSGLKQLTGNNNNNAWGFQFKALPINGVQLYGQLYADRLDFAEIGEGSWKNQYAVQLGLKYFNVAKVANLDGQIELNVVRPFTYTAQNDSLTSYTHYNQPLAHPLGNNFAELIGLLRYQPMPRLTLTGKVILSKRGVDSNSTDNIGNGIFGLAANRTAGEKGYPMFVGKKEKGLYGNLNIAYEIKPNIFFEAGGSYFKKNSADVAQPTAIYLYGGLRWNISRREYDIY